ncbi:MAG: glycoside hydrolase family 20 zincin-like fold domain-containing protein, partial [Rhodothermia bacterium]
MDLRLPTFLTAVALHVLGATAVAQSGEREAPVVISWGVVDNYVGGRSYFESRMTVRNAGSEGLGDDWAIYFNFIRRIRSDSLVGPLSIRLLNGSFYEMKPEAGFRLAPGDSVSLRIIASNWVIRKSAAPSGFYIVTADGRARPLPEVQIEPFLTDRQVDRYRDDEWPLATAATRFETNKRVSLLPDGAFSPVIPTPAGMRFGEGSLRIEAPVRIRADERLSGEAGQLSAALRDFFGLESIVVTDSDLDPDLDSDFDSDFDSESDALISLSVSAAGAANSECGGDAGESYELDVGREGIRVAGTDEAGVFYGIQSLLALIDPAAIGGSGGPVEVPHVAIADCPRFPYR